MTIQKGESLRKRDTKTMTSSTARPLTTTRPQKVQKIDQKQVKFQSQHVTKQKSSIWSIFDHSYCVSVPLAATFLYLIHHYLKFLDMDKRVYNHVPGECSFVGGLEQGAVAMEWLNNQSIILSTGADLNNASNSTGRLALWHTNENIANELKFTGKAPPVFNPYSISTFVNTVFVINNRKGRVETDSVEILEFKGNEVKRKRKHVASKYFTSLVSIVALGPTQFYVSNQYMYRSNYMQHIEFAGHFKSGSIYYFDGRHIHNVINRLKQPAGMAKDGNKLYIAEFGGNNIHIYNVNDLKKPEHLETISLPSAPWSIAKELRQTAFTVTTHPLKLRFMAFYRYPDEFLSPSNVIRIKKRKDASWQFTQYYSNDGATIRGAVTALRIPENRIVFGNVNKGLLKCHLNLT
ncbi:unnamed protein product [Bursaphelenchus okinawaensis]|uniref:Uncharacterized protein n=1 Tax=Bursaphelenchus okinawaensis TaxID=465554 RepID=A0A811KCV0_9BILA|nr:unnamed protein product [Bursaphelenchus okinawaensis]CAG9098889.1 unnamed protein product [Bursaphelenchus okinawaensis]